MNKIDIFHGTLLQNFFHAHYMYMYNIVYCGVRKTTNKRRIPMHAHRKNKLT